MKKSLLCLLLSIVILGTLSGCTTRLIDFSVISSKNIDWSRANEFQRAPSRVEGVDLVHWIIFIPTGVPNAKEALDKAIESVPGAVALLDGVMSSKFWWIPYIYGQQSYIVEGTPLIDKSLASAWIYGDYCVTRLNNDGTVKETKAVSEEEYTEIRSAALANR